VPLGFWWIREAPFFGLVKPPPRTAVLMAGFRSRRPVRVFAEGWGRRSEKFAPESVAATLAQWNALASAKISLTHSMIVLEPAGEPRLTDADRDRFWKAFQVPLFEQIIGERCELLAFECEAHDGLHIASGKLNVAPDAIDASICGCGRTSPRVTTRARRIAAFAD
jgi:hypothetical protein